MNRVHIPHTASVWRALSDRVTFLQPKCDYRREEERPSGQQLKGTAGAQLLRCLGNAAIDPPTLIHYQRTYLAASIISVVTCTLLQCPSSPSTPILPPELEMEM